MFAEIVRGKGARNWRVRLKSPNGEILVTSEGYFSRWNARRAARRMFPGLQVREP